MNKNILIYGVPGVGKTYITRSLSTKTNTPLIELDTLRKPLQKGRNISDFPFLFYGTTEAYKFFGDLNRENVKRGLLSVRDTMNLPVVEVLTNLNEASIIEGAFIDPQNVASYGKILLLVQENETIHRKQFFKHREYSKDIEQSFIAARYLQEDLISEAVDLKIPKFSSKEFEEILRYTQS